MLDKELWRFPVRAFSREITIINQNALLKKSSIDFSKLTAYKCFAAIPVEHPV